MKTLNHFFLIALLSLGVLSFTACTEDEPVDEPTPESVCTDNIKNAITDSAPDTLCSTSISSSLTLSNDPDKNVDYVVNESVTFTGGTLTIEPGTVIEFNTNTGFTFRDQAVLNAMGTESELIKLRGFGGDLTRWTGLIFINRVAHQMHHCEVQNAGGNNALAAIYLQFDSQLELQNSSIINSASYGLCADGDGARLPNFSSNIIRGSASYPVSVYDGDAAADLDINSSFTNNGTDRIRVGEEPGGVGFIAYIDQSGSSFNVNSVPYEIVNSLQIEENSSLTLDAGVTLLLDDADFLVVRPDASLTANGGASAQVTIDQVPGASGKWSYVENFGTISISNATITNGGNDSGTNAAMIYNHGVATLNISNSTLSNSATAAVSLNSSDDYTESNNTYLNNSGGDVIVRD